MKEKPIKEVTIVGFGPSRYLCSYVCETWGCNDFYLTKPKRLDKIFITDRISPLQFNYEDLAKQPCLVTSIDYPDHPEWKIELYPIHEIIKKYGTRNFSNSIAYMIAYAVYYNYKRIWLYGVEPTGIRYIINEHPGVEYWLGIARANGVELMCPCEGVAMTYNNVMYGYWTGRVKELECRRA